MPICFGGATTLACLRVHLQLYVAPVNGSMELSETARRRKRTLTITEAAKILGIGRNQAYEAARAGTLPTIAFGERKSDGKPTRYVVPAPRWKGSSLSVKNTRPPPDRRAVKGDTP